MPDLVIQLLGVPRIVSQGRRIELDRRKALAMLAYLAVEPEAQSRDSMAELLWPDLSRDGARAALRSTLPSLTALSAQEWLRSDRATIGLLPDAVTVDVRDLRALLALARAHTHPSEGLCAECAGWLQRAAAMYVGPLLAGFALVGCPEFELWHMTQQEWLRRDVVGALRQLARAPGDGSLAWAELASSHARRWVELDPLSEEAHRALMYWHTLAGRRTEALRQFKACAALIEAELGAQPEEATVRLAEQIRSGVPLPPLNAVPGRQSGEALPPLPALAIGRDAALAELRARLSEGGQRRALTIIQGWPGVGKSTIVGMLARDAQAAALFPDGVLWASLGERPSLRATLEAWAGALGLALGGAPSDDEIARQLTAALRERRALLLIDDVWQADHAAALNVGGQRCATVVTTRLNEVAQALAPTPRDIYRLAVLPDAAGVELLSLLAPEAVAAHPAEARQLVSDLEGLPLAIQVAGRLLSSEQHLGWGVGELLEELRAGARLLAAQLPGDMRSARHATTPTIAALLTRSTDALGMADLERFALLGMFVPKPASFDLGALAAAWGLADARPTARLLVSRGLLEPIGAGRFQMHALLVMHARALLLERFGD